MSSESKKDGRMIRIALTPAQQEQVMQETGRKVDSIELSVSELEERIVPRL